MNQRKKSEHDSNGDEAKLSEMEAEIDQTRKAISAEIGVIGDKLSPERLKEQAKEKMVDVKDAAVETLVEAKDAAVEKLVDAKDAAVGKLVDAKDAAVEKLSEVSEVARDKFIEAKDATVETITETYEEVRDEVVRVGSATGEFVQRNAIPLTLLGIGAVWLVASNRKRSADGWRPPTNGERSRRARGSRVAEQAQDLAHRAGSALSERASGARDFAQDEMHKVRGFAQEGLGKAKGFAQEELGKAKGFAQEELGKAKGFAQDAKGFAQEELDKARGFAQEEIEKAREFSRTAVQERPLLIGAVALAAGVGVGLLLPVTSKENALLGPSRDKLLEGAKDTVQEIGQVAKGAAHEFTQAAKDAAQDVKGTLAGGV